MRALVVVPTYNERDNLEELVSSILGQGEQFDVLVVDDNSPDGTGDLANALSQVSVRVQVLHRAGRQGLGTAYLAGFRQGLAAGYDLLFEMDADLSHDPAYLPLFVKKIEEGWDVVVGSRNVRGGGTTNWPFTRRLLSRTGSLYARLILNLGATDATAGFVCYKRRVLEGLELDAIHSNGYSFQIEVKYRCQQLGFRLGEIPIVFVDRLKGRSKMSFRIVLEAVAMVWRLRFERSRSRDAAILRGSRIGPKVAGPNRS